MKITNVQSYFLSIPCDAGGEAPPSVGGRAWTHFDVVLIRIDTDEGLSGWGEAFGRARDVPLKAIIDTHIAPQLLGRDPTNIDAIKRHLEVSLHNFGRIGPVAYGIAGVDIALWDLLGKRAGLPLYALIGGKYADEIEVYASLLRYGTTDGVKRITDKVLREGYRHIKLHEIGIAENLAAREAAGPDIPIYLDVNCPWTVREAVDAAQRLAEGRFGWLEEPVWPPENYAGIREVREKGGIRTAAGENAGSAADFKLAFEAGALDFAQPDLTKTLGLSEALRIAALAELHNVEVVPHNAVYGPGLLATLHFNASRPHTPVLERLYFSLEAHPIGPAAEPVNGVIAVPDGPGLGFDPDPEVIEKYAVDVSTIPWT